MGISKKCKQCGVNGVATQKSRKCDPCIASNYREYLALRSAARITSTARVFIWQRDDAKCQYCGRPVRAKRDRYDSADDIGEIDHVVPVIMGGTGEISNLKLACLACNRGKDAAMRAEYGYQRPRENRA